MNTCGQVWNDAEGHRGARMGAKWCRRIVRCRCDTETGKGGHRGHGGTYFRVHCTEGKHGEKQMIAEGHRFGVRIMLGMWGGPMDANRCVEQKGTQKTVSRDAEGHGQACLCGHAYMSNRNEKNRTTKTGLKLLQNKHKQQTKNAQSRKNINITCKQRGGVR